MQDYASAPTQRAQQTAIGELSTSIEVLRDNIKIPLSVFY